MGDIEEKTPTNKEKNEEIKLPISTKLDVSVCSHSGSILEMVVSSSNYPHTVSKSYSAFEQLHDRIEKKLQESEMKSVIDLPVFPKMPVGVDDTIMTLFYIELNEYLSNSFIAESTELHDFIYSESDDEHRKMTAIDFILQPFQYEKTYISRAATFERSLEVNSNEVVIWKFEVEDHDIEFNVFFTPEITPKIDSLQSSNVIEVHRPTRYNRTPPSKPVEGSYISSSTGVVTLLWDNTYSRIRGKNILYLTQVIPFETMESAIHAADAFAETGLYTEKRLRPIVQQVNYSGNWLVQGTVAAAGVAASTFFGNKEIPSITSLSKDLKEQIESKESSHLNSNKISDNLNIQLMNKVETLEDNLAEAQVIQDNNVSEINRLKEAQQSALAQVFDRECEILSLKSELERYSREREAWVEIQAERDELLIEKHRWAFGEEILISDKQEEEDEEDNDLMSSSTFSLDSSTIAKLDAELRSAESSVLSLRAQLGYSVRNRMLGTSNKVETLAKELAKAKKAVEEKLKSFDPIEKSLRNKILKYRTEKHILINAIRQNQLKSETEIAMALAESHEARMVNKRLKLQNELLLKQIRSLVKEEKSIDRRIDEELKESSIPYTLTRKDIALLNGDFVNSQEQVLRYNNEEHRDRLERFFRGHDPERLNEVDQLLHIYRGQEDALFDGLELKYGFQYAVNEQEHSIERKDDLL